ncbi:hypothetical protein EXN32_05995 [Agrobacterium tumefaciens]|uniref:hypothetical protein n=1 Tax=Agrobacterium TaxID=357 RepID=UPI00115EE8A4|nr:MULTISPECIES: hypothetical protein [Agrobacterium]MDA5244915.1 hypothetical protein [Agrobacterium sp. MAFF310724]MDA5246656.1 hypothetical protein [Agrobacterium sp. MAFF210268]TRB17915.1 hypothetical protein EXN32_05995 [Agrobacterium tumefaciens]
MRNSLLAAAIATATIGVSAATQAAEENAPAPQATEQAAPPPANLDLGPDIGPDERPLPPHVRRMPGPDVLGLATKLSAAEIYLGVTPEQLGAWRAYTTALIDLVSPGPERNPPPPAPGESKAKPEPRLAGEELAGIIAQKAEKAKALQDAIAALKPKLSPQQVLKLAELERALMPPPPPGPRHGPADRGGFALPHGDMRPPVPEAERS